MVLLRLTGRAVRLIKYGVEVVMACGGPDYVPCMESHGAVFCVQIALEGKRG
jgi:hypothetical protein